MSTSTITAAHTEHRAFMADLVQAYAWFEEHPDAVPDRLVHISLIKLSGTAEHKLQQLRDLAISMGAVVHRRDDGTYEVWKRFGLLAFGASFDPDKAGRFAREHFDRLDAEREAATGLGAAA